VPTLDLFPAAGSVADNAGLQCDDWLNWDFGWDGCQGEATGYEIEILEPGASVGIVHSTSTLSFMHSTSTPVTVTSGWMWRVRAIFDTLFGDWSAPETFDVEPENSDCDVVPECSDVSGVWNLSVTNVDSSCGPEEPWSSIVTVSQNGCTLEAIGIKETTFIVNGSVVGNTATIGPGEFPDGEGTTSATYTLTLQPDGSATGFETWFWYADGGGSYCTGGTADLTANRQ
jgi:hypothetical protein